KGSTPLGVIDAKDRSLIQLVPTYNVPAGAGHPAGAAHSVAVNAANNFVFVPLPANTALPPCLTGGIAGFVRASKAEWRFEGRRSSGPSPRGALRPAKGRNIPRGAPPGRATCGLCLVLETARKSHGLSGEDLPVRTRFPPLLRRCRNPIPSPSSGQRLGSSVS